jgi:PPP family 3-phenylpropionic acid transporter
MAAAGAVSRFTILYALMYGAFGASSPFLPRFFEWRGMSAEEIGLVFGLGTAVRLVAGPLAGRVADLRHAARTVLAACLVAAAAAALALRVAPPVWPLLLMGLGHAAVLAPTTTLADALALAAATRPGGGFEYGRVRGAASAAFVVGSLAAGRALGSAALDVVVVMSAALLAAAAGAVALVPPLATPGTARLPDEDTPVRGTLALLRLPAFRRVLVVAAMVLGSHALHDAFAMLRWNAAGIGPGTASVLWSEAVVAEVGVFLVAGPALLARVAPGTAMALAALAGVVR